MGLAGTGLLEPNCGRGYRLQAWRLTFATLGAAAAVCLGVVAVSSVVAIPALFLLPAVELVFYFCYYRQRHKTFDALVARHQVSRDEAWDNLRRICEVLRFHKDGEAWLSLWFHGASPHEVLRENALDLLAYMVWFQTREELQQAGHHDELLGMLGLLEAALGNQLAEGRNHSIKFMAHLNEPLLHFYRPLFVYLSIEFVNLLGHYMLLAAGFKHYCMDGYSHYVRPASAAVRRAAAARLHSSDCSSSSSSGHSSDSGAAVISYRGSMLDWLRRHFSFNDVSAAASCNEDVGSVIRVGTLRSPLLWVDDAEEHGEWVGGDNAAPVAPLVLLHGVGLGLILYIRLLITLAATGAPIIAIECKHVSMRWTNRVPEVAELAADVCAVLDKHGHARATILAHSFGTAVASRFSQMYPSRVHQLCLLDPICFNLFMPTVLQNFVYRKVTWNKLWLDLLMLGPARELHCAAGMCRKFFWTQVNLWAENVPAGCLVVLAGRDDLFNAAETYRWLQEHTVANVFYYEDLSHAEVLIRKEVQDALVHQILMTAYGAQRHDSATSHLHGMGGTGLGKALF